MLLDEDELRKYLLKMDREYGSGWDQAPGPHQTGTGGWRDIVQDQLNADQFGPNLPRGLGLLESREQAEQVLGHELVDNTGPQLQPSFKDMMDTSGPRFMQDPYANHQMMDLSHLPEYSGTSIPHSQDLPPSIPPGNAFSHLPEYSGTPMAFDDPSIAGTRIIDHPFSQRSPSPEQMRAMQEQIGGPGFWDAPRFAGANEPMMDDKIRYSDRSDPNFNAPMSFHGGSPSGLLSSEVTPTNKGGKWEKTPEGEDSIYRRKRKDEMDAYLGIMNLGKQISGGPSKWRSR